MVALLLVSAASAQEPNAGPPAAEPAGLSLDDLPEGFPVPEGTSVESGETRGHHRSLKLKVTGQSFSDLVSFFQQQLPEKNFRILNQTHELPRTGFDRACSFAVRSTKGAVFGVVVVETGGELTFLLEGYF